MTKYEITYKDVYCGYVLAKDLDEAAQLACDNLVVIPWEEEDKDGN